MSTFRPFDGLRLKISDAGAIEAIVDQNGEALLGLVTADGDILNSDGSVRALTEASAVVNLTATGTAFTGACEFGGFVVNTETGGTADVTVYDNTSATGTPIMTVANVSPGTYHWDGDWATPGLGNGDRRINVTGCHVVIAGTCDIDVKVE